MKRTSHKKPQGKKKSLDEKAHYYELLTTLLSATGLNKFEIKKRFAIEVIADKGLDLEIDLHRLTPEETKRILSKLLASRNLKLKKITLIHGFHHGVVLKDYINYEFSHDRVSAIMRDSLNEGITHLKVSPWKELDLKAGKTIKAKSKKASHQMDSKPFAGLEDAQNDAKFVLEMMKEKLRACSIKSKIYNDDFGPVLTVKEKQYSEDIFKYAFDIRFFMTHLREFCVYEDTVYMKIRYKKKSMDEVISLIKELTENKADKKYVIVIEVTKSIMKHMTKNVWMSEEDLFDYELKEHCLVISNVEG